MRHEYVSPYVQSANAAARKRALAAREFLKKERKKVENSFSYLNRN